MLHTRGIWKWELRLFVCSPCVHRETLGSEALPRSTALASLDDETERECGGLHVGVNFREEGRQREDPKRSVISV